jgi:hypothetical protein
MVTFGLVTEGPTDQTVIANILFGYFKNLDIPVNRLQPKEDEPGNWVKVFDYCVSTEFKQVFEFADYIIIQVDTDALKGESIPKKYKIDFPAELSVPDTVRRVKEKFVELIGEEFYNNYRQRILFGISVHQIECWLLPIYFQNKPAKSSKITGCISTLNEVLLLQEGFYLQNKEKQYYEKIAKHLRKKLSQFHPLNPSFDLFIQELADRNIVIK